MNSGLMGKCVGTDNCLVGLHVKSSNACDQLRTGQDLCGIKTGVTGKRILTCAYRHDYFFQRGIACAFTETINGAFHLACTGQYRGQGIGNRKAQVVMAVDRENRLVRIWYTLD